jgi:PilZ domain
MTSAGRKYRDTVTVSFGSKHLVCPASDLSAEGMRLYSPVHQEIGCFVRVTIPLDDGVQLGADAILLKQLKVREHYIWELQFQQLSSHAEQRLRVWLDGQAPPAASSEPRRRKPTASRYKIPKRYRTTSENPVVTAPTPTPTSTPAPRVGRPRASTGPATAVDRAPVEAQPAKAPIRSRPARRPLKEAPPAPARDASDASDTYFEEDNTPVEVLMKRALESIDERPGRR